METIFWMFCGYVVLLFILLWINPRHWFMEDDETNERLGRVDDELREREGR